MDLQTPDFYRTFDREVENNRRKDGSEEESMKKLVELRRSELYSLNEEEKPLDKYVEQLEKLALEAGIGPAVKRDLFINGLNEEP